MTYHFPPRLMQAKAAAHYLGISESKLRGLKLPSKPVGGNVLYDRADLDAWADALPYDRIGETGKSTCEGAFGRKVS